MPDTNLTLRQLKDDVYLVRSEEAITRAVNEYTKRHQLKDAVLYFTDDEPRHYPAIVFINPEKYRAVGCGNFGAVDDTGEVTVKFVPMSKVMEAVRSLISELGQSCIDGDIFKVSDLLSNETDSTAAFKTAFSVQSGEDEESNPTSAGVGG